MKNLKLLFTTILISSCTAGIDFSDDAEEKFNLVDQYFKAIEKKDVSIMEEVLADGFISYGPGLKNTVNKKQNIEGWKKSWEERIVSTRYKRKLNDLVTIEKGGMKGDWVSEWGEVTTLYKDGKTIKFWFNGLYKIEENKITEARVVFDNVDVLTQLGYDFLPPTEVISEPGH